MEKIKLNYLILKKKYKLKNILYYKLKKFFFFLFKLIIILYLLYYFYFNIKIKIEEFFKKKIIFEQSKKFNSLNHFKGIIQNKNLYNLLIKKLNETYEKEGHVNINEIELMFKEGRNWTKIKNNSHQINVGAALDPRYILRTMLTLASIMDSQNLRTKLRIHLAVVDNFTVENMLKIYTLRERIREDVEFNFYNAKRVEIELKGLHPKGNALAARLLLPELLSNDIKKLIIFDTGDVVVLRDLSEMYNWVMNDKLYLGVPEIDVGKYGYISKKNLDIYINSGSYLINITEVKRQKIYNKCIENKNVYRNRIVDQDLLNDIGYGKIGYFPIRFGLTSPYLNDKSSDNKPFKTSYSFINRVKFKEKYNFLPKNLNEYNAQAFNPIVAHQWNAKWYRGKGMSIYRRIVQYYIRFAGIWDELCKKFPGYCYK